MSTTGMTQAQMQQMIQSAMDQGLQGVPAAQGGESAGMFDTNVVNQLITQGMNPSQAQAVGSYLSAQGYGGPKGVIGQGGGIASLLPQFQQQVASKWAPAAAQAELPR